MIAKKRRIQQVPPQQQEASPEVIFNSKVVFPAQQQNMRMVFFDQLEEMVEKCTFPCPPTLGPFLKDPSKTRIRLPNDLDPLKFRGKIFFMDYMNIFPAFQKSLSSREKFRLDAEVWKDTSFQQKIENLYLPCYRMALMYYAFSLKGYDKMPPTADDWVWIVCQGQRHCGRVTVESCAFLNGCHVLIVEVPCSDHLHYYPLFSSRDCHLLYEKNEVDDYFLLYCLLYFQSFRDKIDLQIQHGMSSPEVISWLWNQKLVLISNDQYSWASQQKNKVQKLPSPWPSAFSFSMGTTTAPTSSKKSSRKKNVST